MHNLRFHKNGIKTQWSLIGLYDVSGLKKSADFIIEQKAELGWKDAESYPFCNSVDLKLQFNLSRFTECMYHLFLMICILMKLNSKSETWCQGNWHTIIMRCHIDGYVWVSECFCLCNERVFVNIFIFHLEQIPWLKNPNEQCKKILWTEEWTTNARLEKNMIFVQSFSIYKLYKTNHL